MKEKITENIKEKVEKILSLMEINYEDTFVDFDEEDKSRILVSIQSKDDSSILIGPKGSHLLSFNYIIKNIFTKNRSSLAFHIFIDVNDYHKKRIDSIKQKAKVIAERVKYFQNEIEMEPMSSFERRLVHSMFSDDKLLETESKGFGEGRRVVIKYVFHSPSDTSVEDSSSSSDSDHFSSFKI